MESDFLYRVEEELVKAREKHQGAIHTPHEAYGVIVEEVAEFFDEVRAQHHSRSKMLKELVQIAAMCYRAAEDLKLLDSAVEPKERVYPDGRSKVFPGMFCRDCSKRFNLLLSWPCC